MTLRVLCWPCGGMDKTYIFFCFCFFDFICFFLVCSL
jgi:hypothetical protein